MGGTTILILTRKIGEGLRIGPSVRIVVLEVKGGSVRLGIEAPEGILIHRDEVLARIMEENRKATGISPRRVDGGGLRPAADGGGKMGTFETTRFGKIPVDDTRLIHFSDGLLGFPQTRRFLLLETMEETVFYWLQSLDDPALAFVVIDPVLLVPDYMSRIVLPEWDREFFGTPGDEGLSAMAIVTFPKKGKDEATANLQGPLLVRETDRMGRQVVLAESDSWLRMRVFPPQQGEMATS